MEKNKASIIIKYAAVFITLSTGILYLLGASSYRSYLHGLNIEASQFPLTLDRIVFEGVLSTLGMGSVFVVNFLFVAMGVFIVVAIFNLVLVLLDQHPIGKALKKRALGILESSDVDDNSAADSKKSQVINNNGLLDFSIKTLEYSIASVLVILIVLIVPALSERNGYELSKRELSKCSSGELYKSSISIKPDYETLELCSITCNTNECAYISETHSFVIARDGRVISKSKINK